MKKSIKILSMLLLAWFLSSCTTEVADFDSIKDAKETAEQEQKEAKEVEKEETPKERTASERQKNPEDITNNETFKGILDGSVTEDKYEEFFKNNTFNIVEFDGAIDLIELIPNKKTRYTLLLRSGDFDPNSQTGPTFKVKDVGAIEDSVKELFLSGNGEVGKNVKIKAAIYGYDKDTGIVELKLISMSLR